MREKPILFSASMVRAILAGAKTQTRRIVKPQPHLDTNTVECNTAESAFVPWRLGTYTENSGHRTGKPFACPYGGPGDRLWVKEAIRKEEPADLAHEDGTPIIYSKYAVDGAWTVADAWPWKRDVLPSMFMPRGLSRISLEVASVRVERLHDISEPDAKAEGATPYIYGHGFITDLGIAADPGIRTPSMYRAGFEQLWREINGAESWDANPWVWVVTFTKATP
jgi:hypothetical protein